MLANPLPTRSAADRLIIAAFDLVIEMLSCQSKCCHRRLKKRDNCSEISNFHTGPLRLARAMPHRVDSTHTVIRYRKMNFRRSVDQ
jgi:hypothetical protein